MYNGTPEENKQCALGSIAEQLDRIDNLLAAMAMPIPAQVHLSALKESLPDMQAQLKQAYFELGGEDVWSV